MKLPHVTAVGLLLLACLVRPATVCASEPLANSTGLNATITQTEPSQATTTQQPPYGATPSYDCNTYECVMGDRRLYWDFLLRNARGSTSSSCGGQCGCQINSDCLNSLHVSQIYCDPDTGCYITYCQSDYQDCNGVIEDGCEVNTAVEFTDTKCGCPDSVTGSAYDCTNLAHVKDASCNTYLGQCYISSCESGWDNCDGEWFNGCETQVTTTTQCGYCSNDCTAVENVNVLFWLCENSQCKVGKCNGPYDDCDDQAYNGCETDLFTNANCGTCGNACIRRPNADTICATNLGGGVSCQIDTCYSGYIDCDGIVENGCEHYAGPTGNIPCP